MLRALRVFLLQACFAIPSLLHGQTASANGSEVRVFVGGAAGFGLFPEMLDLRCWNANGRTPSVTADFRIGVGRSAVRLETRTAVQGAADFADCLALFAPPDGVHTSVQPALQQGTFSVTDVRFGFALGRRRAQLLGLAGLGWMWTHHVPVVVIGTGVRLGDALRLAVDVDANAYRIPVDIIRAEWRRGEIIQEFERRREHHWQAGYYLRVGVEIAPRYFLM